MLKSQDTPLLLAENSIHNKDQRLKLTEFMFEKFRIPAFFLCKDSVLSAFACGRSTALVLDMGHRNSTSAPVYDGFTLQKCVLRSPIGGQTISELL